jgi:hypothetical protein
MQPYGLRLCLQPYSQSDSGLTGNSLNLSTHVLFGVSSFRRSQLSLQLAVARDACRRWQRIRFVRGIPALRVCYTSKELLSYDT